MRTAQGDMSEVIAAAAELHLQLVTLLLQRGDDTAAHAIIAARRGMPLTPELQAIGWDGCTACLALLPAARALAQAITHHARCHRMAAVDFWRRTLEVRALTLGDRSAS